MYLSEKIEEIMFVIGENFVYKSVHHLNPTIENNSFEHLHTSSSFQGLFRYIRFSNAFHGSNYQKGNLNHSFYYKCREKIKITDLQKINSNTYISKVVGYSYFERRLSKKYHFNNPNSILFPSSFLKNDSVVWLHNNLNKKRYLQWS